MGHCTSATLFCGEGTRESGAIQGVANVLNLMSSYCRESSMVRARQEITFGEEALSAKIIAPIVFSILECYLVPIEVTPMIFPISSLKLRFFGGRVLFRSCGS